MFLYIQKMALQCGKRLHVWVLTSKLWCLLAHSSGFLSCRLMGCSNYMCQSEKNIITSLNSGFPILFTLTPYQETYFGYITFFTSFLVNTSADGAGVCRTGSDLSVDSVPSHWCHTTWDTSFSFWLAVHLFFTIQGLLKFDLIFKDNKIQHFDATHIQSHSSYLLKYTCLLL